jgi:CHAD domain-containing protein
MKMLEKYFEQQYELASKNLRLAQGVFSEKTVHELRVSIKRLRALLDFVAQLLPTEAETMEAYFKPFRKIFRGAGKLRDAQVQEILLERLAKEWGLPAPLAYQKHLKTVQEEAFDNLKQIAKQTDLKKWAGKAKPLIKILHQVSSKELAYQTEKILRSRFTIVRQLVQNVTEDEPLHEARKIIKAIYYILHLVFKPDSVQQYQDLKHLEETIGDWHDIAILLDGMHMQLSELTTEESDFLTKMQAEKALLQAQIPTLVKQELRCWKIFGHLKWG